MSIEAIGSKLAEAFALFDIINILAAAPPVARAAPGGAPQPVARSDYRLDGVIEYRGENKKFIITKVGLPYRQEDILKLNITIHEALNPANITFS